MNCIHVPDLSFIDKAAREFFSRVANQTVFAVSGEMGAGKTTFIKALCRELGVSLTVTSPSFAIINEYFTDTGASVYHFDLYRIENPNELYDMGYEDYLYSGAYCFIEWPEKAWHLIPEYAVQVEIKVMEDKSRNIIVKEP
ncbi:MAG: tRNA (adenosine(37)-N6)-threonylcarbamoyltransferase complex ATPase subunit type 1 TsaE [Bacteroidales bacterium]|nr:tRNA (adenosine(37)-N6)-threonylcarbamoyltransferase complex ATPase subunit type 1 TsaE [Bacteroidales bacterium]MBN2698786.1 tRNA (adenosine(37)-N6)-threonylcarbamoyltransferase complex ATPase subunit type 1 TsaE [Bacteroidales bacterium]